MKLTQQGEASEAKSYVNDCLAVVTAVTFLASRRRREMYTGHAHLCVCLFVCLSAAACQHYSTVSDVTCGNGRGCPLVLHYWADL